MELIKDLELLVSDGQKIANFAKLFTRLPEILQALSSAENHLKEVNDALEGKEQQLEKLQIKSTALKATIKELQDKSAAIALEVANSEKESKKKLAYTIKKEDLELEKTRKANNDAVEASLKLMKHELENHQRAIAESKKAMEDRVAKYEMSIEVYAKQEKEAKAKTLQAQEQLNALIEKIKA